MKRKDSGRGRGMREFSLGERIFIPNNALLIIIIIN
jgi:hypothetical protein